MNIVLPGLVAAALLAVTPAWSSNAADGAADTPHKDASQKSVAESAKELGHAVKRDAKAVGKAVKEGAKEVGAAAKRGAKKVGAAVKAG